MSGYSGIDAIYSAVWFHDADATFHGDECSCEECFVEAYRQKWDEYNMRAQQHEWGLCMDCGVGLDDESQFLVDRREKQCECYTCDACFRKCFGEAALHEAVNWQVLGLDRPQYTRFSFSG